MADETVSTSSTSSIETTGQVSQEAPTDNVSGGSAQADAKSTETSEQNVQDNEGEQEFIKDEEGNEYIPRKAFEARIAKLTQQKHDARQQVLESLRSDPTFKKEFMESLNLGDNRAESSEDTDEPTPFEKFVSPLPQEHQSFYRNMAGAIAQEFEGYLEGVLDKFKQEHISPIMGWIGEEKVKTFSAANKDYAKYQSKIYDIMKNGRAKSIEDAYVLASYEDKMKGAQNVGAKGEAERRDKLTRTPISKSSAGGMATRNGKPFGLREALEKAGAELGYTG
jgi:hypothetical protein